jgi:hypothetical protein
MAVFVTSFILLQFISCSKSADIEMTQNSISKELKSIINLEQELLLYDGLKNEIDAGKNDLIELSKIEKKQSRFWNNILNTEENIYYNANDKSSESINADLTKLYSRLRENCEENNIMFEQETSNNEFSGFGETAKDSETNYGFGLSSYDGFWPSFTKTEAKLLGIQGEIISTMIEYLGNSSDEKYPIKLLEITREPVGKEDAQHIGDDKLSDPNYEDKLVRYGDKIKSYAFSISFQSHTSHARSFINQLRSPFLVRDFKVTRSSALDDLGNTSDEASPFGDKTVQANLQLPIVKDVDSKFTLLIEYVYTIDRDFQKFVTEKFSDLDIDEDILKLFFEETGNDKLLAKIQKNLKKP